MPFKFVQSIFLPHNSQSVGARCIARMTKYHVATENAANPMMRYVIIIIFAVVICFCFTGRMRNVSCISGRLSQIYSKIVCSNKESIEINIKKHFRLFACAFWNTNETCARFVGNACTFHFGRARIFSETGACFFRPDTCGLWKACGGAAVSGRNVTFVRESVRRAGGDKGKKTGFSYYIETV